MYIEKITNFSCHGYAQYLSSHKAKIQWITSKVALLRKQEIN